MNTYADLDFVIDKLLKDPSEIPKSFIYCDNIAMGTEIIDHLTERLPVDLQQLGIIRPYNACFLKEYRHAVMNEFREGRVRILVCTDAAGMVSLERPLTSSSNTIQRVVTYLTLMLLSNGNSQDQYRPSFSGQEDVHGVRGGLASLFYLLSHQPTASS